MALSAEEGRSWSLLTALYREAPSAVLLGGWAVWLHTRGPMSDQIDLIVGPEEFDRVRTRAEAIDPNPPGDRAWRGLVDGVRISLYVPPACRLGTRLPVRVDHLLPYAQLLHGWTVLSRSALFVAAMAGLLDDADGTMGRRDRRQLLVLLRSGVQAGEVLDVLYDVGVDHADQPALLRETFSYVMEHLPDQVERRQLRTTAATWILAARSRLALPGPAEE